MYRMFSLIMLLLLLSLPLCGRAEPPETCPRNAISNLPQCIANAVFEGKDADMPEGKDYEIAIEPIRDKNGKVSIPRTIPEALKAMRQMLPRWYLNTLHRSRDDEGCNVIVNRDSYAGLVATWFWVHWKMDAKDSQLRQRFAELGVRDNPQVEQAILFGFCEFVRNGESKALEAIADSGASAKPPH